jgi:hypothetical protein
MPIENVQLGNHLIELKPGYSVYKAIGAPQFGVFGFKDLNDYPFCLGYSLIEKPFKMVDESHHHDFGQLIFFVGSDSANITDFDAEVEFWVDNKKQVITKATCVHILPGLEHGPLNITKVNKPFIFMDIVLNSTPSVRPMPKETKAR